MSYKLLAKKLHIDKKKIITRKELTEYCKRLRLSYASAISYLLSNKYVDRIFRGVFYVKSIEERKMGTSEMTFYEILKEALRIKGIKHWYFGLESAIKLNNLTHEYFAIDFVISDKLKRPRPIEILGHKVRFLAIKKELLTFGIKAETIPYSDIEKTVLDMIYLSMYRGLSDASIKNSIADYFDSCNTKKLMNYVKRYPKTVLSFIQKVEL